MSLQRDSNPSGSIVVFDVETTGKERATDQIVELCLQLGLGPDAESHVWRIRPSVPIHPEAQAVHGITAADLEACPPFAELAPTIIGPLSAATVIVGYNVSFDVDVLQAELARAGMPPLDLQGKQVVDVLRLWHHVEPRTLAAAHEKFCGTPIGEAHAARGDVAATGHVLAAMLDAFGLSGKTWAELAAIANPFLGREKWLGPSNHVQWENGHAIIAFGKYRGVPLCKVNPSFLHWLLDKDFPPHVKEIVRLVLDESDDDKVEATLAARYPRVG